MVAWNTSERGIASFLAPLKRCKKEAVLWLLGIQEKAD